MLLEVSTRIEGWLVSPAQVIAFFQAFWILKTKAKSKRSRGIDSKIGRHVTFSWFTDRIFIPLNLVPFTSVCNRWVQRYEMKKFCHFSPWIRLSLLGNLQEALQTPLPESCSCGFHGGIPFSCEGSSQTISGRKKLLPLNHRKVQTPIL